VHNNYYFLRQLTDALDKRLQGYSVVSCFSQYKEELLIELNNQKDSFFIKAHLNPAFSCLSFPAQYHRAKKNTIDLFGEIILKKFVRAQSFDNERSFALHFEKSHSLVFKMHGNRSNILLATENQPHTLFRHHLKADLELSLSTLGRSMDWSRQHFMKNRDDLEKTYFTLGKPVWEYLARHNFNQLPSEAQWKLFQKTLHVLEQPQYFICRKNNTTFFSLLPPADVLETFSNPLEAITGFFQHFISSSALAKEKGALLKKLNADLESCRNYLTKISKKLETIQYDTPYKTYADVLMANLHRLPKGSIQTILEDFDGNPLCIKLKPELSAQKNAEIFYRKAKNQGIEINKLNETIQQKKKDLEFLTSQIAFINTATDIKQLKSHFLIKENPHLKITNTAPFHKTTYQGFAIWIGKNAVSNDQLTLKHAHKDDLWLHVKDIAGSHVVVKHQAGKVFPKTVIERAAELAAYNSKRRNESLCPVTYTLKKYVRKRKGDPPGMVIVEKETVIMVRPNL